MEETVLVTGGAGYVGSVLVSNLLHNGYRVVVVDNYSFGGEALSGFMNDPKFNFIYGDITSVEVVRTVFGTHQIDMVVHLAAIVGDPACASHPELARRVNLEASTQLVSLSQEYNIKQFIFVSTCSNYGKMENSLSYVDENSPLSPVSLYAELKVQAEKVVLSKEGKNSDFCPTVLRLSTVYGISPRMRFDLTVNEFTKDFALGKKINVFGEQFWRPYCHVSDISQAILLVLNSPKEKTAYEVFNVGDTNENYQKRMIIEEIKKIIPSVEVNYVHKNEDPRDYRVSFKKIKEVLGFSISKTVPDGVREVRDGIMQGLWKNPEDDRYKNC